MSRARKGGHRQLFSMDYQLSARKSEHGGDSSDVSTLGGLPAEGDDGRMRQTAVRGLPDGIFSA
jgi:hypothetical protein